MDAKHHDRGQDAIADTLVWYVPLGNCRHIRYFQDCVDDNLLLGSLDPQPWRT